MSLVRTDNFRCPNCNNVMDNEEKIVYNDELYDKWTCEDCSHILVLDYRGEE